MIVASGRSFHQVKNEILARMKADGQPVETERWQGVRANTQTHELRNVVFEVDLQGIEYLDYWQMDIEPNLPWADDHFKERVGGEPLNPGEVWQRWPWGLSASKFRDKAERFNHTYSERLWPKYARRTPDGRLPKALTKGSRRYPEADPRPHYGIGGYIGDLDDLVDFLANEPYTRQAWIPLFHPEDTGVGDGGRKMCSLGYQFLVRNGLANIWYPLRSCDLRRHFQDDCYLAVRMLLWVIQECRKRKPDPWNLIVPGTYAMHMTSLHVFDNDMKELREKGGWT